MSGPFVRNYGEDGDSTGDGVEGNSGEPDEGATGTDLEDDDGDLDGIFNFWPIRI